MTLAINKYYYCPTMRFVELYMLYLTV